MGRWLMDLPSHKPRDTGPGSWPHCTEGETEARSGSGTCPRESGRAGFPKSPASALTAGPSCHWMPTGPFGKGWVSWTAMPGPTALEMGHQDWGTLAEVHGLALQGAGCPETLPLGGRSVPRQDQAPGPSCWDPGILGTQPWLVAARSGERSCSPSRPSWSPTQPGARLGWQQPGARTHPPGGWAQNSWK